MLKKLQKIKYLSNFADKYIKAERVYVMKHQNLEETYVANILRNELFKISEQLPPVKQKRDLSDLEMISNAEKTYVSPIFSMDEDEILAFVENFEVNELATLSTAELNHIGKVLGVDPKILIEGED